MSPIVPRIIENFSIHIMGSITVMLIGWAAKSLGDLSRNVQSLNIQVVALLEKINSHEARIYNLEKDKQNG